MNTMDFQCGLNVDELILKLPPDQRVITPHFNLAATAGFIDPFRAANYLDGAAYFVWDYVSETGGPVLASNVMQVGTRALGEVAGLRRAMVIVSSIWTPERHDSAALRSALWRWARGAGRHNAGRAGYGGIFAGPYGAFGGPPRHGALRAYGCVWRDVSRHLPEQGVMRF